ncbi:MAG: glycoside hydrolase family 2 TIM barrel-domain containing protein [Paludibacter sp.]
MKKITYSLIFFLLFTITLSAQRKEISLNGKWQIAVTDKDAAKPTVFPSEIPVPGIVDMAIPALESTPVFTEKTYFRERGASIMFNNSVYWYRRTFSINEKYKDLIQLKINKAQYHTWVYINGKKVGENMYNFTPTLLNIKSFLKKSGQENELIIAVGSRNNLPDSVINGYDAEKIKFTPGIYDDVTIIMSGNPFITNVQTVPEMEKEQLRVVAEVDKNTNKNISVSYTVRELISKKVVAKGLVTEHKPSKAGKVLIDFRTKIQNMKLWSPESPFLYELELSTGADNKITRFGMRSFSTDPEKGVVLLNGKPYYLRGTNVCLFRFFEDSERAELPWDKQWVTNLHKSFKDLNWNGMRTTLGFPPEKWYEVADSLGFLIQDEYPVWGKGDSCLNGTNGRLTSNQLANEFKQWMRERWNHPCVVIWDAQNETKDQTIIASAINSVRSLDLSNRPWDNGWASPASETDVTEAHHYLFWDYYETLDLKKQKVTIKEGVLKDKLMKPRNIIDYWVLKSNKTNKPLKNPVIVNEYGQFWVNRDGSPTTLSDSIFANLFPEANTPEKRLETYSKMLAMKTEYWRTNHKSAGVFEFCSLGYSRTIVPRGQTSDHFSDVKNLIYEPNFLKYMKPAFSPVGIMIEFWDEKVNAGKLYEINVNLINDTYQKWTGSVKLSLIYPDKSIKTQSLPAEMEALGKMTNKFQLEMPEIKGNYMLEAEILVGNQPVKSVREFVVQ